MIKQTINQDVVKFDTKISGLCVMKPYSAFNGQWSEYYSDYKYIKLPKGDHSSIGDCNATLKVLNKMYDSKKKPTPNILIENIDKTQEKGKTDSIKKWWEFWK